MLPAGVPGRGGAEGRGARGWTLRRLGRFWVVKGQFPDWVAGCLLPFRVTGALLSQLIFLVADEPGSIFDGGKTRGHIAV